LRNGVIAPPKKNPAGATGQHYFRIMHKKLAKVVYCKTIKYDK
jgi:hypothetical protein